MKRQVFTMANDYQTQALEQVANLLLDRMDAEVAPQIALFARKFFAEASPSDLAERQVEDLYGSALVHELMAVPNPDFTMLSVAMRELRGLSDQAD